jgi:hypothetical protein
MKRITHTQLKRLANGENPEAVLRGRCDWADLIRALAKYGLRQKALRFADDLSEGGQNATR